jgi:hypothetical protein
LLLKEEKATIAVYGKRMLIFADKEMKLDMSTLYPNLIDLFVPKLVLVSTAIHSCVTMKIVHFFPIRGDAKSSK